MFMEPSSPSDMRSHILNEAARLFVIRGYDGISMREIAASCHISKPGLYYYFVDKEDLFLAILESSLEELTALISEATSQPGGTPQKLGFLIHAIFTRLPMERRALIRLAAQEMNKLSPQKRESFSSRYHATFIDGIADILRSGIQKKELRSVDPEMATWAFLGMMYPFFSATGSPRFDETAVVHFLLDTFLNGLSPQTGEQRE
ncbi:transcriptional regulator, TetR family [Anaerolinea thermolimosa]|uniref:TetR/AcrR family transcriptional regulator n=1 Tax=Anaerolinea thermolimosa TaxID=229919 RepID=UPI0009FE2150|nr:TetR/AcrR family transcriptional regulator [Anaerolinea thermolimosa]GAP05522.1 transcriptional regulator, TetR family [Anaerolinea thermolimosa]